MVQTQTADSLRGELETIRTEIAATQIELDELAHAPRPVDDAIREAESWVDRQAAKFPSQDVVSSFMAPDSVFEDVLGIALRASRHHADQPLPLGPLLAWFDGARLKKQLAAAIKAFDGAEPGPPLAERPRIRRDLEQRLFQLGRREEAVICQLEDLGCEVFRRADLDPAAVLLLTDEDQIDE